MSRFIIVFLLLVIPAYAEVHPAIQRAISWAQTPDEKQVDGNFLGSQKLVKQELKLSNEEEFRNFVEAFRSEISKGKDQLTFQPNPEMPGKGLIEFGEDRLRKAFAVTTVDEKWTVDIKKSLELWTAENEEIETQTMEEWLVSLTTSLEMYQHLGGHFPSQEQGLMALIEKPIDAPKPRRWTQALDGPKSLLDQWGNPIIYELQNGKTKLTSLGPDGLKSEDDIVVSGK